MASGHLKAPHPKVEQMAAPTSTASPSKIPCQQGAVHRWPNALYAPGTSTNIAVWMGHRSRIAKTWQEGEPGEETLDQRATQPTLDRDPVISDELIGREGPSSGLNEGLGEDAHLEEGQAHLS